MSDTDNAPRQQLQRELIELVATAFHEFSPPTLLLVSPTDKRPDWQRRLGEDEKFKAHVLKAVRAISMATNDTLVNIAFTAAQPLLQLAELAEKRFVTVASWHSHGVPGFDLRVVANGEGLGGVQAVAEHLPDAIAKLHTLVLPPDNETPAPKLQLLSAACTGERMCGACYSGQGACDNAVSPT